MKKVHIILGVFLVLFVATNAGAQNRISIIGGANLDGFLYCNGVVVSRTTYKELFAAIATAFGRGNGSTTFNKPDFRGYFLRGQDNGQNRPGHTGARDLR